MKNLRIYKSQNLRILIICFIILIVSNSYVFANKSVDPATILKEFVSQIKLYENFYPVSYTEKRFFEKIKQINDVNKICNKVQIETEKEKNKKFIIKDNTDSHFKNNSYSLII